MGIHLINKVMLERIHGPERLLIASYLDDTKGWISEEFLYDQVDRAMSWLTEKIQSRELVMSKLNWPRERKNNCEWVDRVESYGSNPPLVRCSSLATHIAEGLEYDAEGCSKPVLHFYCEEHATQAAEAIGKVVECPNCGCFHGVK